MSTKLSEIDKLLRELEDSIRETMILAADLPQDNVAYGSPKGGHDDLLAVRKTEHPQRD